MAYSLTMYTGTILHHKYYNGVIKGEAATHYTEVAHRYFGHFGMFGTGMFSMIAKGPDIQKDYEWRNTDLLIESALANGSHIHFNTVITGHLDVFPEWYKQLSPEEKLYALESHVRAVINRYKNKISFFKLVNEATRESDEQYLGTNLTKTDLIANIFKWAVDAYPEGKYMLNEYGCLINHEIREKFLRLVDEVKTLGGRIDIIGEQAHSGYLPRPFYLPPDEVIINALDELHKRTELPIVITEFDLSHKNGDYAGGEIAPNLPVECDGVKYNSWYDYQAFAYTHFQKLCQSLGYVEGMFYWSMADDPTITWERPGCGLFTEQLKPKEGLKTLLVELESQKTTSL